jgi:hypothetical protein
MEEKLLVDIQIDQQVGRDSFTMGYFDNLDNEFLNKYEKIFKMIFCRYIYFIID